MTTANVASKPFFRADHVGSLLRPPEVLEARSRFARGEIDAAGLRPIEDDAIRTAVRNQESVGLAVVTDGELRRENWYADFIGRLGGVEIREAPHNPAFDHDAGSAVHYVPKNVVTVGPLRRPQPLLVRDFTFLAGCTSVTPKITLPSPSRLHFHGGRAVVSTAVYPDLEQFFADIVTAYRAEIASLETAGCRYIQVDDPVLAYFLSERMQHEIVANGEQPAVRLARYIALLNDCLAQRHPETAIGLHICRGNARSAWLSEGAYDPIAEQLFGGLNVDHFLLEYDDERSGGFEPLRFLPPGRRVVLGLITTKRGALEDPAAIRRRVEAATRYVPLENLGLSPQCGFASVVEGNLITPEDQWAKLRLVVEAAQAIWPD